MQKGCIYPPLFNLLIFRDYKNYFEKQLKDCDAAIAVGGGLFKFTCENFSDGLLAAAMACNKLRIPFIINAIGVEGHNPDSHICRRLEKVVRQKSLVSISTRDDLETLKHMYIRDTIIPAVAKVADPAVWAAEVFGISKNAESKTIGLGIARRDIFTDYGINFTPQELKQLYLTIAHLLKRNGYRVELFTNGSKADNEFAQEIFDDLRNDGISLNLPADSTHLISLLSNYCGVIATRLHSCIIAYSLNIPAVGIVWNQKMAHFAADLHIAHLYKTPTEADATMYVSFLRELMSTGYDQSLRAAHRRTIKSHISQNAATILSRQK